MREELLEGFRRTEEHDRGLLKSFQKPREDVPPATTVVVANSDDEPLIIIHPSIWNAPEK